MDYEHQRQSHSQSRFKRAFKWGAGAVGGAGLTYFANQVGIDAAAYAAGKATLASSVMATKNAIIGVGHKTGRFNDHYNQLSPRLDSEWGKVKISLGLDR